MGKLEPCGNWKEHLSSLSSFAWQPPCISILLPKPWPNIVLLSLPLHPSHFSHLSKGWAGRVLTWCPSLSSPTRAATAIMNPIKALGLNDGGGLEASLAGLGRPPGISAPSLPSKASARSHWPDRAFELSAQGQLDQWETSAGRRRLWSWAAMISPQQLRRIQDRSMLILASPSFIFN